MQRTEWQDKMQTVMQQKNMDIKDLHRAIGVDQRILEELLSKSSDRQVDEDLLDNLFKLTQERDIPEDMLKFKQPVVLAIWTHKGGTGKTTISSNLSYELARRGYNVLAIDTDDQCDMTSVLYPNYINDPSNDFYDAFTMRDDFMDGSYIKQTDYENLDIVQGSAKSEGIETSLSQADDEILKKVFAKCLRTIMEQNYYDFIVIDMDKKAGKLNRALLCQCDYVISPLECAQFSSKSIINIATQIENIQKLSNRPKWMGILLNKVDNRRKASIQANKEQIEMMYPGMKFETYIDTDNNFDNSQANFMPIGYYSKSSRGNKKLVSFVDEIVEKLRKDGR